MSMTSCPAIEAPCANLPSLARGQKVAFCTLCQKNVHNLSALAESERRSLLQSPQALCVRYALLIPALLIGGLNPVMAQDDSGEEVEVMDRMQVTGGRVAPPETVFRASDVDESFDDESVLSQKPK